MSIIHSRKTLGGLSRGLQISQRLTMKLSKKNPSKTSYPGFKVKRTVWLVLDAGEELFL
jgi:hypothetical protein